MVAFNCMPINTEQWDFQELKALVGSSGQFPAANVLLLNMEPAGVCRDMLYNTASRYKGHK